jgi:hypothetical protein
MATSAYGLRIMLPGDEEVSDFETALTMEEYDDLSANGLPTKIEGASDLNEWNLIGARLEGIKGKKKLETALGIQFSMIETLLKDLNKNAQGGSGKSELEQKYDKISESVEKIGDISKKMDDMVSTLEDRTRRKENIRKTNEIIDSLQEAAFLMTDLASSGAASNTPGMRNKLKSLASGALSATATFFGYGGTGQVPVEIPIELRDKLANFSIELQNRAKEAGANLLKVAKKLEDLQTLGEEDAGNITQAQAAVANVMNLLGDELKATEAVGNVVDAAQTVDVANTNVDLQKEAEAIAQNLSAVMGIPPPETSVVPEGKAEEKADDAKAEEKKAEDALKNTLDEGKSDDEDDGDDGGSVPVEPTGNVPSGLSDYINPSVPSASVRNATTEVTLLSVDAPNHVVIDRAAAWVKISALMTPERKDAFGRSMNGLCSEDALGVMRGALDSITKNTWTKPRENKLPGLANSAKARPGETWFPVEFDIRSENTYSRYSTYLLQGTKNDQFPIINYVYWTGGSKNHSKEYGVVVKSLTALAEGARERRDAFAFLERTDALVHVANKRSCGSVYQVSHLIHGALVNAVATIAFLRKRYDDPKIKATQENFVRDEVRKHILGLVLINWTIEYSMYRSPWNFDLVDWEDWLCAIQYQMASTADLVTSASGMTAEDLHMLPVHERVNRVNLIPRTISSRVSLRETRHDAELALRIDELNRLLSERLDSSDITS